MSLLPLFTSKGRLGLDAFASGDVSLWVSGPRKEATRSLMLGSPKADLRTRMWGNNLGGDPKNHSGGGAWRSESR